jgi:hypothetical protein
MRLLRSWSIFSANAHKCKPGIPKYEKYKDMLAEMCDLADGDEEQVKDPMRSSKLPTWERDYRFYLNQKAGVIVDLMDGVDRHLAKRQKTVTARNEKEEKQKKKEEARVSLSTRAAAREAAAVWDKIEDESGDSAVLHADVTDEVNADPDAPISYWHQYQLRKKPETVTLNLPRKGLAKLLTQVRDECTFPLTSHLPMPQMLSKPARGRYQNLLLAGQHSTPSVKMQRRS